MERLSLGVQATWVLAQKEAAAARSPVLEPEHFLAALTKLATVIEYKLATGSSLPQEKLQEIELEASEVRRLFLLCGLNPDRLRHELRRLYPRADNQQVVEGNLHRSPRARQAFGKALDLCIALHAEKLTCLHLLVGLLEEFLAASEPDTVIGKLTESDLQKLRELLSRLRERLITAPMPPAAEEERPLDWLVQDWTEEARQGCWGGIVDRRKELGRLLALLTENRLRPLVLLGEAGVGKKTLVRELARRVAGGSVPPSLQGYQVLCADPKAWGELLASPRQWRDPITHLQEAAKGRRGFLVFFPSFNAFLGAPGSRVSARVVRTVFVELPQKGIRPILAATPGEWAGLTCWWPEVERACLRLVVPELSPAGTLRVLRRYRTQWEAALRLEISEEVLESAVELSLEYLPDQYLPGKAIWLLEEAFRQLGTAESEAGWNRDRGGSPDTGVTRRQLSPEILAQIIATRLGMDVSKVAPAGKGLWVRRIRNLAESLKGKRAGSAGVVEQLRSRLEVVAAGLGRPRGPRAVFLFVGPRGAGKVRMARALAEAVGGSLKALARVDLSRYRAGDAEEQLLGRYPRCLNFDRTGILVRIVREGRRSVLLFEHVDRTSPEVWTLLSELLGRGFVADPLGRRAEVRDKIVILTCDLPEEKGALVPGEDQGVSPELIDAYLCARLPASLLALVDEVLTFEGFSPEELNVLVEEHLRELSRRLERNFGKPLRITAQAAQHLLDQAKLAGKGIRGLRQLLDSQVRKPLSRLLGDGACREWPAIEVIAINGEIGFRPGELPVEGAAQVQASCCECRRPVPSGLEQAWRWMGCLYLCPMCRQELERSFEVSTPGEP